MCKEGDSSGDEEEEEAIVQGEKGKESLEGVR